MATKDDLINQLTTAYNDRYGDGSVLECSYIGALPSNSNFYRFKIIYTDDDGVVKENANIIAYSSDGSSFTWAGKDPTQLPPKPTTPSPTFNSQIRQALVDDLNAGNIKYFEIRSVDNDSKRARAFIRNSDDTEDFYIVYFDSNNNLVKEKTSLAT